MVVIEVRCLECESIKWIKRKWEDRIKAINKYINQGEHYHKSSQTGVKTHYKSGNKNGIITLAGRDRIGVYEKIQARRKPRASKT